MSLAAIKGIMSSSKVNGVLPDFNQIWNFSANFHETPQHQIS
jgi:hypothetical protein